MKSATAEMTLDEELLGDAIAFEGVAQYHPAQIKCALLAWMAFKDASTNNQCSATSGDE